MDSLCPIIVTPFPPQPLKPHSLCENEDALLSLSNKGNGTFSITHNPKVMLYKQWFSAFNYTPKDLTVNKCKAAKRLLKVKVNTNSRCTTLKMQDGSLSSAVLKHPVLRRRPGAGSTTITEPLVPRRVNGYVQSPRGSEIFDFMKETVRAIKIPRQQPFHIFLDKGCGKETIRTISILSRSNSISCEMRD